ncbi:HbrB-domain-containing protein [Auriculariales sp. MPI-PUGE-AT-0066]|nr:HbrB-domain-containing protein [Auriculariales sp. MPI-PUGE-AT-0066]
MHAVPRVHSRGDSGGGLTVNTNGSRSAQISPSKTANRTYDSQLVSREMRRLGQTLSPSIQNNLSNAASASVLSLPASSSGQLVQSTSQDGNAWGSLHQQVLPLFNGDALRLPIEDLNTLVRQHVNDSVVKRPSRAFATLENDLKELIGVGMLTLNSKLTSLDDEKLLPRLVDLWGFFWDQILAYVEAVFLPFQTEPILLSLGKARAQEAGARIDVRELTLRAFRNDIIYPIYPRLATRLSMVDAGDFSRPRLQQMLLVLISTANRSSVQPEPAEAAISHLIRLVRAPTAANGGVSASHSPAAPASSALHAHTSLRGARHPSFLSAGMARDRRGRIQKPGSLDMPRYDAPDEETDEFDTEGDGATPRGQYAFDTRERQQGLNLLRSLKSPESQGNNPAPIHSHRPSLDSAYEEDGEDYGR